MEPLHGADRQCSCLPRICQMTRVCIQHGRRLSKNRTRRKMTRMCMVAVSAGRTHSECAWWPSLQEEQAMNALTHRGEVSQGTEEMVTSSRGVDSQHGSVPPWITSHPANCCSCVCVILWQWPPPWEKLARMAFAVMRSGKDDGK